MEEARKVHLKAVKKDNFPLGDDREDEDALDVESQLKKEIEELNWWGAWVGKAVPHICSGCLGISTCRKPGP